MNNPADHTRQDKDDFSWRLGILLPAIACCAALSLGGLAAGVAGAPYASAAPDSSSSVAHAATALADGEAGSALAAASAGQDCQAQSTSPFTYIHDPRDNPSAMADIVIDEEAIYGFSPSPDGSLREYVDYDWTDPASVEAARQQRISYHESFSQIYDLIEQMRAADATTEEIARAVSARRNELRIAAYADDPDGLAVMKARNLETYGDENGGSPEYFFDKYGSWEKVIEKSLSVNSGMDACLGLYDEYYDLYVTAGQVPAKGVGDAIATSEREDGASSAAGDSDASDGQREAQVLPVTCDALMAKEP